ncbi:MAG: HdeD family acid-resistance protein [Candidatus Rokubacteria bacterium]|nr:HdeD family acid-resistance protein [Candidatus Rokubacteria bacterium]
MYSGLARNWKALAARGVLAILFGLFALTRPGIALPTLVLGFGVAVLLSGILAIVAGVRSEENRERSWPLTTEGVIAVAVGLLALLRPDAAARLWLFVVSGFAFASGILHIFAAIRLRRDIRDERVLVVNGALTAAFGVLMVLLPWAGLLALGWLVGAYSLCFGVLLVAVALRLRTQWHAQHPKTHRA